MKAAVLTAYNSPLSIEEVGLTSLQYGQVLVKVLISGICGAQLQEIRGEKGNKPPHLLGHEGCGIVQEIGPGVSNLSKGDKVVMHWRKGLGIESPFPEYIFRENLITSGRVTTFSEYSICSENRLTRVPDSALPEFCALLGCGLSTALATIESEACLKFGESVLIVGCGGLGSNLILSSKLRGAGHIAVTEIYANKKELALRLGASEFFHAAKGELRGKFDVIIDTSGNIRAIADTLPHLAPSGRFIMIGQPAPSEHVFLSHARHMFDGDGKTIKATQGGGFMPHLDIPRYLKLYEKGGIELGEIVTDVCTLSQINSAIESVKMGEAGRILVKMT